MDFAHPGLYYCACGYLGFLIFLTCPFSKEAATTYIYSCTTTTTTITIPCLAMKLISATFIVKDTSALSSSSSYSPLFSTQEQKVRIKKNQEIPCAYLKAFHLFPYQMPEKLIKMGHSSITTLATHDFT